MRKILNILIILGESFNRVILINNLNKTNSITKKENNLMKTSITNNYKLYEINKK